MRNASAAMNRAKRAGRNSVEFYTPEMNTRAARQLRLENELREAIERNELVLHYQPQIDLVTGQIVGLEALVRWRTPDGLVGPGEFIAIAQERGLILPMGRWVIGEAIRQIAAWEAMGLSGFTVAVNLTAAEFHNGAIVDELTRVAGEHGVAPARIELELTESIAVQDVESTRRTLYALHERGFQLSLDDFGTGYSSLAYLRRFPIDKIKIDRSFVSELATVPGAVRIVRAIIALARSFEMKVIAEGVETMEQLQVLRAERCDQFQGFLASPALPAAQLEALLRESGAPF
jgi:EAL domain-containing protein (putative c-di-GMP-specific phosphodiesterase class I)